MRNLKVCLIALLLSSSASAIGPPFAGLGVGGITGNKKCEPSPTTASGSHVLHSANSNVGSTSSSSSSSSSTIAPPTFCSGELIFEDTFDTFDVRKWQHESTLAGGSNWEFQWYTNNRSNSFCEEGFLHVRPTLTSDVLGESFLTSGRLELHGGGPADTCTNAAHWGCERTGTADHPLNPVRSARLRTADSFAFKYGKVEVSAKMPAGDWLWPAIWLMPRDNAYGTWPASGEIDLVESRGNRELLQNGVNIGGEQLSQTLHFGPYPEAAGAGGSGGGQQKQNAATFVRSAKPAGTAWSSDVHRYQMEWTPEKITFSVDDIETGTIAASTTAAKGFWARGGFDARAPGSDNPWRLGSPMAPFDQEFYMIINLAVGGTNHYFPDDAVNAGGTKPWLNDSPRAAADFWAARNEWLPTWNLEQNLSREASLIVDYVRVWAL